MTLKREEVAGVLAGLAPLVGATLQEIRVPGPERVVLALRVPGETHWLLVSSAPRVGRLHRIERAPPNPERQLAFQGLLRKELRGRLVGLERAQGERIARLRFQGGEERSLVLELYGGGGNIVLLDGKDRVLGRARSARRPGCDAGRGARWQGPDGPVRWLAAPEEGAEADEAAIAERLMAREQRVGVAERLRQARSVLQRRLREARRLEQKRERDLARAGDPEVLRRRAELLQGSFHLLSRGQEWVDVTDWAAQGQPAVRVEVEPSLSPAEQVARAFERAKRAERARERGQEALDEAALAVLELEELAEALEGDAPSEGAVEAALAQAPKQTGAAGGGDAPRLPYRAFRTEKGVEIRVGRSASDNDELTLHLSKGNDVWLHVRGRPGAHVVIRGPGPSPAPELLVMAAQLALLHSGLGDGAREEVAWTRVKHVTKPKGAKPGSVRVTQEKSLYVEADPTVLEKLTRMA